MARRREGGVVCPHGVPHVVYVYTGVAIQRNLPIGIDPIVEVRVRAPPKQLAGFACDDVGHPDPVRSLQVLIIACVAAGGLGSQGARAHV